MRRVHVFVVTNFIFIDLKATSAFITYTFVQSFLMKHGCLSDHYYRFAFTHYHLIKIVFLFSSPCFFLFFFPFICFVIVVNHYFDGHIENMVFVLTLFVCWIVMCFRFEIKNLLYVQRRCIWTTVYVHVL